MTIEIPPPDQQLDFAARLKLLRGTTLQEALLSTVSEIKPSELNADLDRLVPAEHLQTLQGAGLRGELLFAVPVVLRKNPRLFGYYRMLLGYSQKDFNSVFKLGRFLTMETGKLTKSTEAELDDICAALVVSAGCLLEGLGAVDLNRNFLDDLTLLTLGAFFRGSSNNTKGTDAIQEVFDLIREIVDSHAEKIEKNKILVRNSAGEQVVIAFASDPDIVIKQATQSGTDRNILAIEVKGGHDYSNIHNRIGEAEKSHLKARQDGFIECWTAANVNSLDEAKARVASPSTNRFYLIWELAQKGDAYAEFAENICTRVGIPYAP